MDHILFFIVNFHTRGVFGLHWDGKKKLLKNGGPHSTVHAFFGIIHGSTILFQLTFNFIYSTFNNKFSVSAK